MLDDMGIIHMNGRIYDARIARFLQADPFIQSAANTQSYNRYSYLLNNPLNATDPSGFFLKKWWNEIRPFVGVIVAAVLCYVAACIGAEGATGWGLAAGAASGAAQAAANGGNILLGAFTGMLTAGVGAGGGWGNFFARGAIGGASTVFMGGKFGHGFISAGIGGAFGSAGGVTGFVQSAIVGGTVSMITGGKFANGARSSAISYLIMSGAKKIEAGGNIEAEAETSNGGMESEYNSERVVKDKELALAYLTKTKGYLEQSNIPSHTLEAIEGAFGVTPGDPAFNGVVKELICNIDNTIASLSSATFLSVTEENLKQVSIGGRSLTGENIQIELAKNGLSNAFVYAADTNKNIFIGKFYFSNPTSSRIITLIHEASHFHPDGLSGGLIHPTTGNRRATISSEAARNPYNFSSFIISN